MHPATLYGVGVITKLYFAIFAAFKESMTLNLAQRSFKVLFVVTVFTEKPLTTLYMHVQTFTKKVKIGGKSFAVCHKYSYG